MSTKLFLAFSASLTLAASFAGAQSASEVVPPDEQTAAKQTAKKLADSTALTEHETLEVAKLLRKLAQKKVLINKDGVIAVKPSVVDILRDSGVIRKGKAKTGAICD